MTHDYDTSASTRDASSRPKVLVVDPSPATRALYQSALATYGVDVRGAGSAAEALQFAAHWQPSIITTSAALPDGDGFTLCLQLRRKPETVLIPVIIITSSINSAYRERALQVGALDLVEKGRSLLFYCERIRAALDQRQITTPGMHYSKRQFRVLVAEDSSVQLSLYEQLLHELDCDVITANNGEQAWQLAKKNYSSIDVIITDLNMPELNGDDLCHLLRASARFDSTPIIVITSLDDRKCLNTLLNEGVNDYLIKPFSQEEFHARIKAHLRNRQHAHEQLLMNQELQRINTTLEKEIVLRTRDLHEAHMETVFKLAVACDHKSLDTANHIQRVKQYVERLARAIGVDEQQAREFGQASMMHDIGKIAIPDAILNKPESLNVDEWKVMQSHTTIGAAILGEKPHFATARDIALYHHERFDGNGYPFHLKGESIPLSARLLAVADTFDSMLSPRCYKPAQDIHAAIGQLGEIRESQLDPLLVDSFLALQKSGQFEDIRRIQAGDVITGATIHRHI